MCLEDPQCTHWSWKHLNYPEADLQLECCLKDSYSSDSADSVNPIQNCGMVSGVKSCNDD